MIAKLLQPLVVILALSAAVLPAAGEAPSSSRPEYGERHIRLKIDRMLNANQISADQHKYIMFLMEQQEDMVALFTQYGLLTAEQMLLKKGEILEITSLQIACLLTDIQKARWDALDQRLHKPSPRRTVRVSGGS